VFWDGLERMNVPGVLHGRMRRPGKNHATQKHGWLSRGNEHGVKGREGVAYAQ